MSRVGVKVAIRTRPTAAFDQDEIFVDAPNAKIDIHHKSSFDVVNHKNETWNFKYHSVQHNAAQDAVYDNLCRNIVTDACNGTTGCIMAYGQTGSGKTFTMIGDPHSYRNRGVVPRTVAHVFQHIATKPEMDFSISMSYMEIYGEKIRDLLVVSNSTHGLLPGTAAALGITNTLANNGIPSHTLPPPGEFNIIEDPIHGTVVRGLTLVPANSEEDVLQTLFQAELARTTADHQLNKNSNRSHCIFTIYIQQRSRLGGGRERIISSKIHLVDLAGSERIKKTMGTGPLGDSPEAELQKESMAINKSLTYLEQCVVALTTRGRSHVPYKNSRLTNVLKDALGGNCNTLMIACVWGEARHLEETISTLRFAQRMMAVQNEVSEAAFIDTEAMVKKLTREVAQLKQELQMHDALADRTNIQYGQYTPEQQAALSQRIHAFLDAQNEEAELTALPLESVQQMREILRQFKIMIRQAGVEAEERLRSTHTLIHHDNTSSSSNPNVHTPAVVGNNTQDGGVGIINEAISGLGLGLASSHARPNALQLPASLAIRSTSPLGSRSPPKGGNSNSGFTNATFTSTGSGSATNTALLGTGVGGITRANIALDLNGAWKQFKTTPGLGAEMAGEVSRLKRSLAERKAEAAASVKAANIAKERIEYLVKELADIRSGVRPTTAGTQASVNSSATANNRPQSSGSKKSGGKPTEPVPAPAPPPGPTPEEEEARLSNELLEAKHAYRAAVERINNARQVGATLNNEISQHLGSLLRDFETWYASCTGRLPPIPVSPARDRSGSPFKSGARQQGFGANAVYDWTATMSSAGVGGNADDVLDDAEAFEKMEIARATSVEPDSAAYFTATRKIRQGAKAYGKRH